MPCTESTAVERAVGSPSPLLRESPGIATSGPSTRRRTLPWQDTLDAARPAKRRALPGHQDLQRIDDVRPAQRQALLLGMQDHAAPAPAPAAKPPAHPAEIIARVEEWKDGAGGNPVSDDECDSPIDWDEPDMIPSTALTDGSRPSWSRHNARIEAKIDRARQFHGVFDVEELRPVEQVALQHLKRSLDVWNKCCVVCDFTGNPGGRRRHPAQDCPDRLNRIVQIWAPLFLPRLQRLARAADTQSCPTCLVPKLLCKLP
ncbi:hypothetical protein DL95DRAFT_472064 [Leptodontidium sp. 2 PMI_412]|nr:hypothetical protein DL95DRAFT_472064 [Leptodontidium sp. 2 PMI_412]